MMRRTDRTGYTIVEVVIAMLVMGILASVAAPRYSRMVSRYRVEAAARRIVADLNQVRARAISIGASAGEQVIFFPATEQYQMIGHPDPDHPSNVYVVDFSKTAYPVDLVSADFSNNDGSTNSAIVSYNMYGLPKSGSSTVLPLTNGTIIVASGSQQRTVAIDPVTGKASVR